MDFSPRIIAMPLVVTLLMLAVPLIPSYILGPVVLLLSIILYTIHKTHYLTISVAVLALLYTVNLIPTTGFIGPMMMVWGEYFAKNSPVMLQKPCSLPLAQWWALSRPCSTATSSMVWLASSRLWFC